MDAEKMKRMLASDDYVLVAQTKKAKSKKLKHHCQPNALDSPQQAVVRKRHEDWLTRKVIIQDLHKIATFLWPKFNQLRMLSHSDRNAVHAHVCTLLQAMAAGAPDVEIRDPELSGVKPTPLAKRANFAEWENVRQAEWEDDELTQMLLRASGHLTGPFSLNKPYRSDEMEEAAGNRSGSVIH
ncbi:unnamed protein product [Leuciscus chuanchicus]